MRLLRRVLAIVILALAVQPVLAQDDALQVVTDAYTATLALQSYEVSISQMTTQNIVSGSGDTAVTLSQIIAQGITGQIQNTDGATASSVVMAQEQRINRGDSAPVQVAFTLEIVSVDGEVYLKFSDFSPESAAAMVPVGWFNVQDAGELLDSSMMNTQALSALSRTASLYPLNADTITEIREVEDAPLDDVDTPTRAFDVVLDVTAVLENGAAGMEDAFNFASLGLSPDAGRALIENSTQITMRVWVGEGDGLIYQIDSRLTMGLNLEAEQAGGTALRLDQVTTNLTRMSAFNVPVAIAAPVVEQE